MKIDALYIFLLNKLRYLWYKMVVVNEAQCLSLVYRLDLRMPICTSLNDHRHESMNVDLLVGFEAIQ